MMVGDAHGKVDAWTYWIKQALKWDVSTIWSTGDLIDPTEIVEYLDRLQRMLERTGIQVYVTDGNHDPVPVLRAYLIGEAPGVHLMRANLQFVDRGNIVELDGVKFMSLGGAASMDRERRIMQMEEGGVRTWWPEETLTNEEVLYAIENAKANGPVDVMVTHDYPDGLDFAKHALQIQYPECIAHRRQIRKVLAVAQPNMLYHGHHHIRYSDHMVVDGREVLVRGLADGSKGVDSFLVFDTEEYRERFSIEQEEASV